jgi:hypothetical protein
MAFAIRANDEVQRLFGAAVCLWRGLASMTLCGRLGENTAEQVTTRRRRPSHRPRGDAVFRFANNGLQISRGGLVAARRRC